MEYQVAADALKGKVILVTGAGDGIGRQAAISYAQHGATVILLGRTVKKLESVYDEIEAAGYPQPAIIPLDMMGQPANTTGIWLIPSSCSLENWMAYYTTQAFWAC